MPIVSPTAEASGEEQTSSQFFSRVINNSTTVEEDSFVIFSVGEDANPSTPLRSMLKLKYPRKSQQTVDNLNAGTELKWKEEENCTQYSKQSLVRSCASDVNAILHTASTQDPRRAAQILKHIVENNPLLQNAIVEELSEFSKKKKNKKVLQKIGESINVYTSELDAIIVNNINAFSNTLHSNGTRLKSDQEAINTVHTAVMYKAEDSIMKRIIQRIHIPKAAVDKALTRMRQHDTDIKLHYKHGSRKIRKDEKRIASLKYVRGFCHNNNWDRSTKVDTGEYRLVNSTDENGNIVKCMVRRWEDLPTRSAVYSKWHNSEQAKQFAVECKLNPICKTIFWKNVCPCCRFGTKDMCSDQVMTGLEESRAAFEKALRDPNLSKDAFLCKCPYHEKEKERNPFVNYHTSDSEDESEAGEQGQGLDDGDSASASDSDSESDSGGFCRAYSKSWLGVFCVSKAKPLFMRHAVQLNNTLNLRGIPMLNPSGTYQNLFTLTVLKANVRSVASCNVLEDKISQNVQFSFLLRMILRTVFANRSSTVSNVGSRSLLIEQPRLRKSSLRSACLLANWYNIFLIVSVLHVSIIQCTSL